jgi:hypothetical protein
MGVGESEQGSERRQEEEIEGRRYRGKVYKYYLCSVRIRKPISA